MAWIKIQPKTKKEKVLPVNKDNFPELNVTVGNCHSVQIRENGFYAHTSGDGCNGYVRTGNFDTKKYKTIIVYCQNNSWGTSVPTVFLYVNGVQHTAITGGGKDVTVDVAGRDALNVALGFAGNGNDNAWMDVTMSSITFVP
jgi:hypothetical protein